MKRAEKAINDSIIVKQQILSDKNILKNIVDVANECVLSFKNKGKVLFCGNGGSAADAQHLAAELSGRFYYDRPPLDSEALHVNTSYLTAVGNDYGFAEVFSRLIQGRGRKGDILIGLSTSGNSPNIIKAIEYANSMEMITVAFTGDSGGKMRNLCHYLINAPSGDSPRIQEAHIMIGHVLCEIIEQELFPNNPGSAHG